MQALFEHTSVKRAYFTLAMPVVLNMVVTLIYNMVDTFFVAQTQNANLVAGVSQGAPLFTLMIALGDILGLGGASAISRLFGEHRYEEGRRVSGYCFYAAFFFGLAVMLVLFFGQAPFLRLLGADHATWKYAREYYLVIAAGAKFCWFFACPAYGPAEPPTPEQLAAVHQRVKRFRETEPLLTLDFWDGPGISEAVPQGGKP